LKEGEVSNCRNEKRSGCLFIAAGWMFFVAAYFGKQVAFYGVGVAFLGIGGSWLARPRRAWLRLHCPTRFRAQPLFQSRIPAVPGRVYLGNRSRPQAIPEQTR
jgi:hypothetical protein